MATGKQDDAARRTVAAAAAQAGVAIPASCLDAVVAHYAVLAAHAGRVMAAGTSDEDEPAPVFRP